MFSVAFVASSFRVTEENLLFETVHSSPPSVIYIFLLLLKDSLLHFISVLQPLTLSLNVF